MALGLAVHTLLKLVGVILLAFLGLSVTGAILAQVAASVGVLGYLSVVAPPPRTMPAFVLARPMLMMALPLGLYAMAFQVHVHLAFGCSRRPALRATPLASSSPRSTSAVP